MPGVVMLSYIPGKASDLLIWNYEIIIHTYITSDADELILDSGFNKGNSKRAFLENSQLSEPDQI